MKERMHYLMRRHLEAALTPEEAAELAAALSNEEAAGEAIAECLREAGAASLPGHLTGFDDLEDEDDAAPPRRVKTRWVVWGVLAAALIAAAAWLSTIAPPELPAAVRVERPPGLRPLESGAAWPAGNGAKVFITDTAYLRRELRRFTGGPLLREVPVTKALADLESAWKAGGSAPVVTFAVAPDVRSRWNAERPEPVVSLELPATPLLTRLELLAALSGLHLSIAPGAVQLEAPRQDTAAALRTWTLPLEAQALYDYGDLARNEVPPPSWSSLGDLRFPVVPDVLDDVPGTLEFPAPPSPLLQRIFDAHGVKAACGFDAPAGVVSVKAELRHLRAASILIRAIGQVPVRQ